jgi:pimeloyl-ACP methyl ester carboxylesterase
VAADASPLVLLHGLAMSGDAWRDVVPLVRAHHDTYVPTAAGHRGGPPVSRRPARMTDIVDAAERYLDMHGLDRPHLAGSSMGGFVAVELARRARASTVCAFSPGGLWTVGDGFQRRALGRLQRGVTWGRRTRRLLPYVYRSAPLRRIILRDVAFRADRLPPDRALEMIDDGIGCEVLTDLCAEEWVIDRFDPLPCPVTVVWGDKETLVPPGVSQTIERIPHARVKVLPGVGHVPMIDDPALVARTILACTGELSHDQ